MRTVSIIIPVYNLENVLKDTLESILKQSYENLQIILVNDGSTDGSVKVCNDYADKDNRIILINKENGGVSSARNLGLEAATGDFVMFVDGDDLLEPNAVETMISNIDEFDSDICVCSNYFVNNEKTPCAIDEQSENVFPGKQLVKLQLYFRAATALWLCMIKRHLLEGITFNKKVHTLEDWKFMFDVFAKGVEKTSICRKPLYHYMVREGSASHSPINDKKMSCFNMTDDVLKTINERFPQFTDIAECHDSRLLIHLLVIAGKNDYVDKKYSNEFKKIARRMFWKTLKSKYVLKRFKLYILMTAISPKIYYFSYKFKYKVKGILRNG